MLIRRSDPKTPRSSEITPESVWLTRRQTLVASAASLGTMVGLGRSRESHAWSGSDAETAQLRKLTPLKKTSHGSGLEPSSYDDLCTYNNFYEFGTDKRSPARLAKSLETSPWSVRIEGEVDKPGDMPLETLLGPHSIEERIYRFRCVEAWSAVVPWAGFPLAALLRRLGPTSDAKYVEFQTLYDPEQMPGQRRAVLDWPYREGLRMDEAMHPLTLLVTGLYGRELPNQSGAPLRLIVPWKYGFKSIKSIVGIRLRSDQPGTTWNQSAPDEYGFYANVNPDVDHPRWSQKRERALGSYVKQATLPFNGYAEDVADLYRGMDLTRFF